MTPISANVNDEAKHENLKADAADLILIDFAKSGTNGHRMDQTMGKTGCSAKNHNFVFLNTLLLIGE